MSRRVFIGLVFVVAVMSASCIGRGIRPPVEPASTPDPGILTTEKAQAAVDRFVSANGKGGRLQIRGGVREITAQNAAIAELDVEDFAAGDRIYKGNNWQGQATFSKYTEGRWTLTQIDLKNPISYSSIQWKPIIDVR